MEFTLIKFADDTKLREQMDTLEDQAAIQGNLDMLEEQASRNFMTFSKVLPLGICSQTLPPIPFRGFLVEEMKPESELRLHAKHTLHPNGETGIQMRDRKIVQVKQFIIQFIVSIIVHPRTSQKLPILVAQMDSTITTPSPLILVINH
ncbi:disintegrin/metalloproteinase [Limosa lapponica baueri]|uniref:Disintegrin/metalloproteinase n=1 Tax=Limosa lapponica baueri TaxID=1758121 RepID=A0A2I0URT2_LIMLA|nr:disintegrin/metalloproteinase [Limosa lapponica baueri]